MLPKKEGTNAAFSRLLQEGRMHQFLLRLDDEKQRLPVAALDSFLPTLFELGDSSSDEAGMFEIGTHTLLVRIALGFVRQLDEVERRQSAVMKAMETSKALSVPAAMIRNSEKKVGEANSYDPLRLFSVQGLKAAKDLWLTRVKSAAQLDRFELLRIKTLPSLLYCWRHWGDPAEPVAWIKENIGDNTWFIDFIAAILSRTLTHSLGSPVEEKWSLRKETLDHFLPHFNLQERAKHLSFSGLTDRQQLALSVIRENKIESN